MGKCIIEAPRGGSSMKSVKARHWGRFVKVDGEIEYEGISHLPASRKGAKIIFRDCKDFSDKLGPLQNYLRTSCGRLWDDVYSEIAYNLGRFTRAEGIRHIISDHLDVATSTFRATDGNVYEDGRHGVHRVGGFPSDFYVEPETGILRGAANYRKWRHADWLKKEAAKPVEMIPIADGKEYRKIKMIWYYREWEELTLKERVEEKRWGGGIRVAYQAKQVTIWERKRQLGKKDLKVLNLRNG